MHHPPPRCINSWVAGPEEATNPAGKSPPPDSDPFESSGFMERERNNGRSQVVTVVE
jgi:hypothetical protein